MKQLSTEELWRLDTDDEYLLEVIREELSKKLSLRQIEKSQEEESCVDAFLDAVECVKQHQGLNPRAPTLLKGF